MEKKRKRLLTWCAMAVFLLAWGSADPSAAKARLDVPGGNPTLVDPVPLPLVKKIALKKAKDHWGPGTLGDPVPLTDLNGDVVVYMIPFRFGKGEFPAYDEIMVGVKSGRELKEMIKNTEWVRARETYARMAKGPGPAQRSQVVAKSEQEAPPPLPALRSDGSLSRREELKEFRKIEKFASRKAIGADEYGTLLVSATYGRFPVLAYFHSLAPYYVNFDLALAKAEEAIGQGAVLKRIYFLGLEGQYFEFENGGSTILLNWGSLEATTLETLKKPMTAEGAPQTDPVLYQERKEKRKGELQAEWGKIKSEIGEK